MCAAGKGRCCRVSGVKLLASVLPMSVQLCVCDTGKSLHVYIGLLSILHVFVCVLQDKLLMVYRLCGLLVSSSVCIYASEWLCKPQRMSLK